MTRSSCIYIFVLSLVGSDIATDASVPFATRHADGKSGGDSTVFDDTRNAFSLPAHNLDVEKRDAFFIGNSFFNQNWVTAPATPAARDGLGPLFNARSCSGCHFKDGRSQPPEHKAPMRTMLLRISVPSTNHLHGVTPDPVYGDQIQTSAINGVEPEAQVIVQYHYITNTFADGESFELRFPTYSLMQLAYGPVADHLQMSGRVTPHLVGLGLLEAIDPHTLEQFADPHDVDGDGISGKLNRVWNEQTKQFDIGRFGWKAEQPTVHQQAAAAFHGDMGLTTSLFSQPTHTQAQQSCANRPNGGSPEVSDLILSNVVFYSRTLGVPARRNPDNTQAERGELLFHQMGCARCHVESVTTGNFLAIPELSQQTIHAYTDLLLHDMGPGLDDGRPVFEAMGAEWRTPPLWGIGLIPKVNGHSFLLHDGRARSISEAILWHGGEGQAAKERFRTAPKQDRDDLTAFLQSL